MNVIVFYRFITNPNHLENIQMILKWCGPNFDSWWVHGDYDTQMWYYVHMSREAVESSQKLFVEFNHGALFYST